MTEFETLRILLLAYNKITEIGYNYIQFYDDGSGAIRTYTGDLLADFDDFDEAETQLLRLVATAAGKE